jgi:hypothetical protein
MCFNIISKQKSKQTSNIFKKNPWPAQEITAKKHKTIMFSKLLDSREKNLFILYLFYTYIYTCNTYIYMLLQLLLLLVVFFCGVTLHWLVCITCQSRSLAHRAQKLFAAFCTWHFDHLITSNSLPIPNFLECFKKP